MTIQNGCVTKREYYSLLCQRLVFKGNENNVNIFPALEHRPACEPYSGRVKRNGHVPSGRRNFEVEYVSNRKPKFLFVKGR